MGLIIDLLKKDLFDQNKNEIHNSILKVTRVYESNEMYIKLIKNLSREVINNQSQEAIVILRKLCVANDCPFVQHQLEVCNIYLEEFENTQSFLTCRFKKSGKDIMIKIKKPNKKGFASYNITDYDSIPKHHQRLILDVLKVHMSI